MKIKQNGEWLEATLLTKALSIWPKNPVCWVKVNGLWQLEKKDLQEVLLWSGTFRSGNGGKTQTGGEVVGINVGINDTPQYAAAVQLNNVHITRMVSNVSWVSFGNPGENINVYLNDYLMNMVLEPGESLIYQNQSTSKIGAGKIATLQVYGTIL